MNNNLKNDRSVNVGTNNKEQCFNLATMDIALKYSKQQHSGNEGEEKMMTLTFQHNHHSLTGIGLHILITSSQTNLSYIFQNHSIFQPKSWIKFHIIIMRKISSGHCTIFIQQCSKLASSAIFYHLFFTIDIFIL